MCTAVLFHPPHRSISHRECCRSIASCLPDVVDWCLCHHWCQKFSCKSNAEFWNTPDGLWSGQWDKTELDTQGHRDVSGGAFIPQTCTTFFFFFLHMLIHRHINSFSKLRNWKIVPQTKHPMLTLWDICTIKHYWQQVTGAVMQLLLYILQIHAEASFELARRGLIKCMSKFWKHSTIVSSTFTVPTHHCTLISHNIINTCLILCWSPCGQLLWDLWRCAVVSGTLM